MKFSEPCRAFQCFTVHCTAGLSNTKSVYCSVVLYSAVHGTAVKFGAVRCNQVDCNTVKRSVANSLLCSTLHYNSVLFNQVHSSTVLFNAIEWTVYCIQ